MGAEWRGGTGHRAERSTGPRSNAQKLARVAAQHKTGAKAKADGAPTTFAAEKKLQKLEQRAAMREQLHLEFRQGAENRPALLIADRARRHNANMHPEELRRRAERRAQKLAEREALRAARADEFGSDEEFSESSASGEGEDSDDEVAIARRALEVEQKIKAAAAAKRAAAAAAAPRDARRTGHKNADDDEDGVGAKKRSVEELAAAKSRDMKIIIGAVAIVLSLLLALLGGEAPK
jgi:hypothetical protein